MKTWEHMEVISRVNPCPDCGREPALMTRSMRLGTTFTCPVGHRYLDRFGYLEQREAQSQDTRPE